MMLRSVCLGAVLLALGGCIGNMREVRDAPTADGLSRTFPAPYNRVSVATVDALHALNVDITSTEEQPGALQLLVERRAVGRSDWGGLGRVLVLRTGMSSTPVRVVWEKRNSVQFYVMDDQEFARRLFAEIHRHATPRTRHDPLNLPR